MQLRELPRGGQYSLKGSVVNVPVDVSPTVNALPRNYDSTDTNSSPSATSPPAYNVAISGPLYQQQ